MRTSIVLLGLLLTVPVGAQNSGEEMPPRFILGTTIEDDIGTLPEQIVTHYLIVQNAPELHGFRSYQQVSASIVGVYEFVDMRSLLQRVPPVPPAAVFGGSWSSGEGVLSSEVFPPGHWLEPTAADSGCVSAPCSEPNSMCSGWCSGVVWHCVCTPIKAQETARSAANRHLNAVDSLQEVFPPN